MVENTYKSVYKEVCQIIKPISENYLFESTELCCHFLSINKADLILKDLVVANPLHDIIINAAKERAKGYPLQYIIGEWEFYGRKFDVGEGVLIPRADTETLIDAILDFSKEKDNLKIADLCSGSGCIAVTLKKELPSSTVYALEKSNKAYEYLLRNIKKNQADVVPIHTDVLDINEDLPLLDVVVSNPPYLTKNDMEVLQKEVQFEPEMALYGQDDGLYFYREITKLWKNSIKSGGILAYEIGLGQEKQVTNILHENGFKTICQKSDLCGIIRVVYGVKK